LALDHVQVNCYMPWEKKLPREEVHLDFPPLPPAVVNDTIHSGRTGLRSTCRVNLRGKILGSLAVTQFGMPDFMRHQKCLFE